MRLIDLVEEINESIVDTKSHQTDMRLVLSTFKSLINQSNQGMDTSKIQEALNYLELMPFQRTQTKDKLFSNMAVTTLGDEFKKKKFTLGGDANSKKLIQEDQLHIPVKIFSESEKTRLKILYLQLLIFYKELDIRNDSKKIKILEKQILLLKYELDDKIDYGKKWNFNLVDHLHKTKEASPALVQWKEELQVTPEFEDEAKRSFCDFRRNFTIDNKSGSANETDQEIEDRINIFLKKSIYKKSPQDIAQLRTWLSMFGGQQMNMFLTHLLKNQTYESLGTPTIGDSETKLASWTIDKDGRIFLDLNIDISMINFLKGNEPSWSLITDISNKHIAIFDLDNINELCEITMYRDEHKIKNPPLLAFETRIEIKIIDGVVTPSFTKLNITGFTNLLSPPINEKPSSTKAATPEENSISYQSKLSPS